MPTSPLLVPPIIQPEVRLLPGAEQILAAAAAGLVLWLASGADRAPHAPSASRDAVREAVPGIVGSLARPEASVTDDAIIPDRGLETASRIREARGAALSVQVSTEGGIPVSGVRINLYQDGRIVRLVASDGDGIALATGLDGGTVGIALIHETLPWRTLPPPPELLPYPPPSS